MGENPPGLPGDNPNRYMYFFIHNVFANFFKDSLDYFAGHLYPRFEHRIVATYDKAVEYLTKKDQYGREVDKPQLPALILNPSGDFELADAIAGGKQFWRFPNLDPGLSNRLFIPVYDDNNVMVTVGFIRIQGDIELLMLLNSFYEYCDLRMMFIQIFAGFERWIYPQYFTSFIILPEELINYEYSNPYTGLKYTLDWRANGAYDQLVRTTAKNELVLPCSIKPIYKLTSFSDASQRYGGTDKLADWRLGAIVHYEIEIPAWLLLIQDYVPGTLSMQIKAGSAYSAYDFTVPTYQWGVTLSDFDGTTYVSCGTDSKDEYQFNTRYYHIVSQTDIDSTGDLYISIPEQIVDKKLLIVNSKYGNLKYGDHYLLSDDGWTLIIKKDYVDLEVDMIIELYIYEVKYSL